MFRFIEFILRDIDNNDLEKKGWFGVLEIYKEWCGDKEDFERIVKEIEEFIKEKFIEG